MSRYEIRDDYKLFLFDLDWTIRSTKSGETFPQTVTDWQLMPGRLEKFQELREDDKRIVVITNQGGLPWHVTTGQDKYPTPVTLGEALKPVIMQLNIQGPWYISLYDQKAVDLINKNVNREILAVSDMAGHSADNQTPPMYETPEEAMNRLQKELFEVLQQFNVRIGIDPSWRKPMPGMLIEAMREAGISREDTLYVGDRPEDKEAAEAALVDFQWSWNFFKDGPIIV